MARAVRFLQPIRSNSSPLTFSFSANCDRFHTLAKSLEVSSGIRRLSSSNWKSYVQRYVHTSSFCSSGRQFSMARLCGMSIVVGSVGLWPRYAGCMDVYDTSLDGHRTSVVTSDSEEDSPAFLLLVKKLLAPAVLLYIVWLNWGHPVIIGAKTILILLSTKPSTYSVYVLIDKWQKQFKSQHPLLHKFKIFFFYENARLSARIGLPDNDSSWLGILTTRFPLDKIITRPDFIQWMHQKVVCCRLYFNNYLVPKSLYAKKVEIEDYTFLNVARVELDDKKYTLIGILGGWWVFERTSLQGSFSSFKKRATEILNTAIQL